jgi:hypothetical protein
LVGTIHGQIDEHEPICGEPHLVSLEFTPHLVDSIKLSPGPQFVDKVRDVVDL